jgi:hypothetical protein
MNKYSISNTKIAFGKESISTNLLKINWKQVLNVETPSTGNIIHYNE